jgi:hypothetical protein
VSNIRPATVCAGAGSAKAAATARNHAFITNATVKINRKNMLHRNNRETRKKRIGYIRLQKLVCGRLQSNHEVEDDGEKHDREEYYWYVDEGKSSGFDEWMVHGSLGMFHYDGTLIEERWDFGQGRDGRPKQGTKKRIKQTRSAGRCVHIQEKNTST